jgi:hypothetical protein
LIAYAMKLVESALQTKEWTTLGNLLF